MSTISFPDWINSLSPQSTDGKEIYQQDGSTPSRGDLDDKASLSAINNDPDFYEEGTWAPTISLDFSETIVQADYIRMGDLVTLHFIIETTGTSSGTFSLRIRDLPFLYDGAIGGSVRLSNVEGGEASIASRHPEGDQFRLRNSDGSVSNNDPNDGASFEGVVTYKRS